MSLILYGDLLSQPSRAALIFCKAALKTKETFQFKHVQIILKQTRTREYKAINPKKAVPVLIDEANKETITDSAAIFRYVLSAFNY